MLAKSCRIVALISVTLLIPGLAHAAAQRTFVSAGGVDNPNCSLAAPCRSFASAIAATLSGGEVIVLDSAGYGPVTITQSASIITPPGVYAGVSVFTGNGVTINGAGISVVLHGLQINGLGGDAGIVIQDAARVRIEHCVVSRMSQMGIFHAAAAARVTVSDTIVRDNGTEGVRMVTSTGSLTLERATIEGNANTAGNLGPGLYVSPNVANGRLQATIIDSLFERNGYYGIWADAGASATVLVSIDRSTISEHGIHGVYVSGSASSILRVAVQRSTLSRNGGAGLERSGNSPATIDVNASGNVAHLNGGSGFFASGTGVIIRVSGNSYDFLGCNLGGSIATYHDNSVVGIGPGCSTSVFLL